jgi:hypothetical protein
VYAELKSTDLAEGGAFVFVAPLGALTTHGFFYTDE